MVLLQAVAVHWMLIEQVLVEVEVRAIHLELAELVAQKIQTVHLVLEAEEVDGMRMTERVLEEDLVLLVRLRLRV